MTRFISTEPPAGCRCSCADKLCSRRATNISLHLPRTPSSIWWMVALLQSMKPPRPSGATARRGGIVVEQGPGEATARRATIAGAALDV